LSYKFLGWSTSAGSTKVVYSDGQEVINLASNNGDVVDLYAVWEEVGLAHISYGVNHYGWGTVSTANEYLMPVTGNSLGSTAKSATGYHFVNWTSDNGITSTNASISGTRNSSGIYYDQSYTANFEPNHYTIVYDKNATSASGSMSKETVAYDDYHTLSDNKFTRAGYEFSGWALSTDGDVVYDNAATVRNLSSTDGDTITLYAIWKPVYIDIFYKTSDANAGLVSNDMDVLNPADGSPAGSIVTAKTGYKFVSWTDSNGNVVGSDESYIPVRASSDELYTSEVYTANFEPIEYTIVFDKNATPATGETASMTCKYNTKYNLSANGFERPGYDFVGWSMSKTATSAQYIDKQEIINLASSDGAVVTLYAVWAENDDVVYNYLLDDPTAGVLSIAAESVEPVTGKTVGSTLTLNAGYKFLGWIKVDDISAYITDNSTEADDAAATEVGTVENDNINNVTADAALASTNKTTDDDVIDSNSSNDNATEQVDYDFVETDYTIVPQPEQTINGVDIYTGGNFVAITEPIYYTVTFIDELTGEVIATQTIRYGENATELDEIPQHDGYEFSGYDGEFENITDDTTIYLTYQQLTYTVTFIDEVTGEVIDTITVVWGEDAIFPDTIQHDGYEFIGWDNDGKNIMSDLTITAKYNPLPEPEADVADELIATNDYMAPALILSIGCIVAAIEIFLVTNKRRKYKK
jgi:uncharacterized repeat protein (TIGR02543 family)